MKIWLKRIVFSFVISSFAGLLVNLLIDLWMNQFGGMEPFVSISQTFVKMFPTPVMAAYVNILLYGVIGATFSAMTIIFEIDRLGFLVQYLIYFIMTSIVLAFITTNLWQLQKIPMAMLWTLVGYGIAFVIMGILQYRTAKRDIDLINKSIVSEEE